MNKMPVMILGTGVMLLYSVVGSVSQEAVLSNADSPCGPGGGGEATPVATATVLGACPAAGKDERIEEAE